MTFTLPYNVRCLSTTYRFYNLVHTFLAGVHFFGVVFYPTSNKIPHLWYGLLQAFFLNIRCCVHYTLSAPPQIYRYVLKHFVLDCCFFFATIQLVNVQHNMSTLRCAISPLYDVCSQCDSWLLAFSYTNLIQAIQMRRAYIAMHVLLNDDDDGVACVYAFMFLLVEFFVCALYT